MLRLILLSFLIVLITIVSSKECPTRSFIEKSLLDAHIPGAVMVVVNTTDIIYQEAFGHQSFSPTQLMDVDQSIFVLASISKTFIAVAIMQLVESKLLDLNTDINQYLLSSDPKISHPLYPTHSITLRQLLSHSASIGQNPEVESNFFRADDKALTETTLAEACFSFLSHNVSNWLPYQPGTVTLYSNVGSSLAALIIERVAKIPYEQYIRERILKPLGIDVKKAGFHLSDIEDQANIAKHYSFNSTLHDWNRFAPQLNITQIDITNWLSIPYYSVNIYPAGLMRMSAPSYSLFLRMFMNNGSSLIRPESIVQMKTVVSGVIPYENINTTSNNESLLPPLEFGLIWHWETLNNGRRYLGHGGTMPGATNAMLLTEKGDLGVIIFTNGDVYPTNDISMKIGTTIINLRLALLDCFEN